MIFKMLANRYAKALYEVAEFANELDIVKKDMHHVLDIFTALPELKKYCLKEQSTTDKAFIVVDTAFLPFLQSAKSANTLKEMAKNQRLASSPFLPDAFFAVCAEKDNSLVVSAEFANIPKKNLLHNIEKRLADKIGMHIKLDIKENSSLLGGFRLRWQNKMIDNSAQARLKHLKRIMVTEGML